MVFPRQEYWSGLPLLSSGDLPDPGIEPRSPALQEDSLLSEPPGIIYYILLLYPWNYPGKNTGVGSLFPLQGIFPIQGLNPGLLHCRQILYYLSQQ